MKQGPEYFRIGVVPSIVLNMVGIKISRQTVYNWIQLGKVNSQGQVEKLKAYSRCGGWYTTTPDIENFLRSIG
jgi:hypothetical protein